MNGRNTGRWCLPVQIRGMSANQDGRKHHVQVSAGRSNKFRPLSPCAWELRPAIDSRHLSAPGSPGWTRRGARVWFFRQADPPGGSVYASDPIIYANGAPIAGISQGTAFFHDFPPGKYRFTVQPFGTPTNQHDTLQLAPGTQGYVQVQWEANWEAGHTGGGSSFTVLTSSPEVGQQYLPTLTNLGQR